MNQFVQIPIWLETMVCSVVICRWIRFFVSKFLWQKLHVYEEWCSTKINFLQHFLESFWTKALALRKSAFWMMSCLIIALGLPILGWKAMIWANSWKKSKTVCNISLFFDCWSRSLTSWLPGKRNQKIISFPGVLERASCAQNLPRLLWKNIKSSCNSRIFPFLIDLIKNKHFS